MPQTPAFIYPRHCVSAEEFAAVQRVRGYLSGLARRARTAGRDRSIATLRKAGMKVLALALYKGVSVATISRVVARQEGEEAKEYPHVPDVLAKLYIGVLAACHTLYANRLTSRKVREERKVAKEIQTGRLKVASVCPSCGLRHRQFADMDICPSCGLRLRYRKHQRKEDNMNPLTKIAATARAGTGCELSSADVALLVDLLHAELAMAEEDVDRWRDRFHEYQRRADRAE